MNFLKPIFIFLPVALFLSCTFYGQTYKINIDDRFVAGKLSDEEYTYITSFLKPYSKENLQDTIIIRYDFNKENCWDMLDERGKDYINKVLSQHQQYVQRFKDQRPLVSLFEFREPGNNINKLKKWDTNILIDSSSRLLNTIIKKRVQCGVSLIIFPSKEFIKINKDPHLEALLLSKDQFQEILGSQKRMAH